MNTITKFFIICLTALFSIAFITCKDDDTTKPTINLIEPAEGDSLQIGGEHGVHFEAEFSDNEMLASYKVDIHPNFDDHAHAKTKAAEQTVDFEFNKSWKDISGKKNAPVHHHEIKIPADATPGRYHLMVYCTDAAGNETYVTVNIVLSHDAGEDDDDDEHEE
jgi:hypothetical protein